MVLEYAYNGRLANTIALFKNSNYQKDKEFLLAFRVSSEGQVVSSEWVPAATFIFEIMIISVPFFPRGEWQVGVESVFITEIMIICVPFFILPVLPVRLSGPA